MHLHTFKLLRRDDFKCPLQSDPAPPKNIHPPVGSTSFIITSRLGFLDPRHTKQHNACRSRHCTYQRHGCGETEDHSDAGDSDNAHWRSEVSAAFCVVNLTPRHIHYDLAERRDPVPSDLRQAGESMTSLWLTKLGWLVAQSWRYAQEQVWTEWCI